MCSRESWILTELVPLSRRIDDNQLQPSEMPPCGKLWTQSKEQGAPNRRGGGSTCLFLRPRTHTIYFMEMQMRCTERPAPAGRVNAHSSGTGEQSTFSSLEQTWDWNGSSGALRRIYCQPHCFLGAQCWETSVLIWRQTRRRALHGRLNP